MWDRLFGRWEIDNNLRMECYDQVYDECCANIIISSSASLRFYQPESLGNYSEHSQKNNRIVYKHTTQDIFLYYNDFGILEGTSWMISKNVNDTTGFAASQDLEKAGNLNFCANQATSGGPWLVLSDYGWQFDKTLLVKCQ